MWLAWWVVVMHSKSFLPLLLIGLWGGGISILALAVLLKAKSVAIFVYVVVIFAFGAVIISSFVSSLLVAVNRFQSYWNSGYPILLASLLFVYGGIKSSFEWMHIFVFAVSSLFGVFLGTKIVPFGARFIPILALTAFTLASELVIPRGVKVLILFFFFGILAAYWNLLRRIKP